VNQYFFTKEWLHNLEKVGIYIASDCSRQ